MIRRLIAGLVVVGLAIGVWALWPRGEPDPSPTTTVNAVGSSTTSIRVASRTTGSTAAQTHVVTTVEEAEEILRALWFGWFEGIYNQDEERIKEVVGSQTALDSAEAQFGVMEFSAPPTIEQVSLSGTELLFSNAECFVAWATIDLSGFREGSSSGVHVIRRRDYAWVSVGLWDMKEDLWQQDCESQLEPLS
ncbi:MAG: hypothetical protein WEE53_05100 [Acidimicrobiia bacterium]